MAKTFFHRNGRYCDRSGKVYTCFKVTETDIFLKDVHGAVSTRTPEGKLIEGENHSSDLSEDISSEFLASFPSGNNSTYFSHYPAVVLNPQGEYVLTATLYTSLESAKAEYDGVVRLATEYAPVQLPLRRGL